MPPRLPETYGQDRLVLMARDPYWIHAYWEVTPATVARAKVDLGPEGEGHRWVLRIKSQEETASEGNVEIFDVDIEPDARSWYLRVPRPDRTYEATIGLLTKDGALYPFAKSDRATTPRAGVSEESDAAWTGSPTDAERILELSSADEPTPSSPGMAASQAPVSGAHPSMGRPGLPAGSAWDAMSPMGPGEVSSPGGEAAVSGAGEAIAPTSGESATAGARGEPAPLRLRCDLVLYGSTRPDARLTVQGRPVGIRPDGTFSVRFELPDGEQSIPCVARSAEGGVLAKITSVIRRQTSASAPEMAPEPPLEV
jgi:hypothetical protein